MEVNNNSIAYLEEYEKEIGEVTHLGEYRELIDRLCTKYNILNETEYIELFLKEE